MFEHFQKVKSPGAGIMNNTTNDIKIYTDGASSNKTGGDGGCAAIILFQGNKYFIQKGFTNTSNSRMELMGVILALQALNSSKCGIVSIYSDSQYVIHAFTKRWIFEWKKTDFEGRKNADLLRTLFQLFKKFKKIEFIWVKGHNGNTYNEKCDKLAGEAKRFPIELKTKDLS